MGGIAGRRRSTRLPTGRGRNARFTVSQLLVTCEHASNRVPAELHGLGLSALQLSQHIAWDPGAAAIAQAISKRIGCPLHLAKWSRLVVDTNRSLGHPKLIAPVTFGVQVPGNRQLAPSEAARRLRKYYFAYRNAVTADVLGLIADTGRCLHLSMHSFSPAVDGKVRNADVGLLYDPRRGQEARFARRLRPLLEEHGLRVRMNYPYLGISDGFVRWLRGHFPASAYCGIEIESNQGLAGTPAGARHIAQALSESIQAALTRVNPLAASTSP